MSRSCSQCGNNGHNSRTCPTEVSAADDGGEKGIMLFGVRLTEASSSSFRKSVSMNNLSQFDHAAQDSNPVEDGGYASDDVVHASGRCRERKRGTPWTEDEHRLFLTGLHKVGKGDWRGISRNFVKTRTPTQVASHAQKYFLRRTNQNRRRRRSSLFDITPDSFIGTSTEENQLQTTPLEGITEGVERASFPAIGDYKMKGLTLESRKASSKLIRQVPAPIPIPIPPSRKMADLNLNKKTSAAPEMFPSSLNLQMQSSSSSTSSNEKQTRGSRASAFETMTNNGDSIMGVA